MSATREGGGRKCKIYVQLHTHTQKVLGRGLFTAIAFVTPRAQQFSLIKNSLDSAQFA